LDDKTILLIKSLKSKAEDKLLTKKDADNISRLMTQILFYSEGSDLCILEAEMAWGIKVK